MGASRKYPLELRERVVRLVFESGRPVRQVARDLGVHHESLRLWVRQAEADSGRRRGAADDRRARGAEAASQGEGVRPSRGAWVALSRRRQR
jgi:transposase-like protein